MIVPYPKRILLVGATSHTGERLARRLRRVGVQVRCFTRDPDSPVAKGLQEAGCELARGDCYRLWTLWDALEDAEVLVSCAHIRFAEVLVQACQRVGVERLVCLSSTRRYSHVRSQSVNEVVAGEATVTHSPLQWTIVRASMIFGGCRDNNVTRLLHWVEKHAWVPIFGTGRSLVQPVYVEDLVTALGEVLRRPNTALHDYTVGGREPITYDDFLREIANSRNHAIRIIHLPPGLGVLLAKLGSPILAKRGILPETVLRMSEDKSVDISAAVADLSFRPRAFASAMAVKAAGEAEVEFIYGSHGAEPAPFVTEGDPQEEEL